MECEHKYTEIIHTKNDGVHAGGRIICSTCDKFIGWNKAEHNDGVRTQSTKFTLEKILKEKGFKEPFCFFCNRIPSQLGTNEVLTIDHIFPIREGGKDEINNINVLCSSCHKLRHWCETYMNLHFK